MAVRAPLHFSVSSDHDGPVSVIVNGEKLDEKAMAEAMAKAKASGQTVTYERHVVTMAAVRSACRQQQAARRSAE